MTTVWLREVEAAVLQRIATAERVFCFLDYDGTLSPLAPTPDAAAPLAGTAPLLQELAGLPGTQVALVTGRTVADLRRFLDVPGICYIGVHGLEISFPNGSVELSESVAMVRSVLRAIRRQVEEALGGRPGILIEDKELALACHYRLASHADAASARRVVAAIAQSYQRRGVQIAVTHGHAVIEIRSAFANKGKTVRRLLGTHGPSALPVYIGDDQTDEDAFRLLPPESVTIHVGPATTATAARYRLEDPGEVLRFLRAMVGRRRRPEQVPGEASET
jgi:trehalose 6-phosphate phosphatase